MQEGVIMKIDEFLKRYPSVDTFVSGEDVEAVTGGELKKRIDASAEYTMVQVLLEFGDNEVIKQLKERYERIG